jgi:hypothetical protein
MSKGDPAQRREVTVAIQNEGTLCTKTPMTRFRRTPTMRLGRMRTEASSAERPWTSWKLGRVNEMSHRGAEKALQ